MEFTAKVKSGQFKGAKATIFGTDTELFNKGVIALSRENSPEAIDYVKRIMKDLLPLWEKVYYATVDGKPVFLNETELDMSQQENKEQKHGKS